MASDATGESECRHGFPFYWNEFQTWSDCDVCCSTSVRYRAWQAFRDFLNGAPEQWQAHSMAALERGYAMREHKR